MNYIISSCFRCSPVFPHEEEDQGFAQILAEKMGLLGEVVSSALWREGNLSSYDPLIGEVDTFLEQNIEEEWLREVFSGEEGVRIFTKLRGHLQVLLFPVFLSDLWEREGRFAALCSLWQKREFRFPGECLAKLCEKFEELVDLSILTQEDREGLRHLLQELLSRSMDSHLNRVMVELLVRCYEGNIEGLLSCLNRTSPPYGGEKVDLGGALFHLVASQPKEASLQAFRWLLEQAPMLRFIRIIEQYRTESLEEIGEVVYWTDSSIRLFGDLGADKERVVKRLVVDQGLDRMGNCGDGTWIEGFLQGLTVLQKQELEARYPGEWHQCFFKQNLERTRLAFAKGDSLWFLSCRVRKKIHSLLSKMGREAFQRKYAVLRGTESRYGFYCPELRVVRRHEPVREFSPSFRKTVHNQKEADFLVKTLAGLEPLAWKNSGEGCSFRATLACHVLDRMGVAAECVRKIWAEGDLGIITDSGAIHSWRWHIAPLVITEEGQEFVLDPAINPSRALTPKEWKREIVSVRGRSVHESRVIGRTQVYVPKRFGEGAFEEEKEGDREEAETFLYRASLLVPFLPNPELMRALQSCVFQSKV